MIPRFDQALVSFLFHNGSFHSDVCKESKWLQQWLFSWQVALPFQVSDVPATSIWILIVLIILCKLPHDTLLLLLLFLVLYTVHYRQFLYWLDWINQSTGNHLITFPTIIIIIIYILCTSLVSTSRTYMLLFSQELFNIVTSLTFKISTSINQWSFKSPCPSPSTRLTLSWQMNWIIMLVTQNPHRHLAPSFSSFLVFIKLPFSSRSEKISLRYSTGVWCQACRKLSNDKVLLLLDSCFGGNGKAPLMLLTRSTCNRCRSDTISCKLNLLRFISLLFTSLLRAHLGMGKPPLMAFNRCIKSLLLLESLLLLLMISSKDRFRLCMLLLLLLLFIPLAILRARLAMSLLFGNPLLLFAKLGDMRWLPKLLLEASPMDMGRERWRSLWRRNIPLSLLLSLLLWADDALPLVVEDRDIIYQRTRMNKGSCSEMQRLHLQTFESQNVQQKSCLVLGRFGVQYVQPLPQTSSSSKDQHKCSRYSDFLSTTYIPRKRYWSVSKSSRRAAIHLKVRKCGSKYFKHCGPK